MDKVSLWEGSSEEDTTSPRSEIMEYRLKMKACGHEPFLFFIHATVLLALWIVRHPEVPKKIPALEPHEANRRWMKKFDKQILS